MKKSCAAVCGGLLIVALAAACATARAPSAAPAVAAPKGTTQLPDDAVPAGFRARPDRQQAPDSVPRGRPLGQLLLTDSGGLTWHAVTF